MSDESNQAGRANSAGEPVVTRSTAPMWIIVVALVLLFVGAVHFDHQGGWFNAKVYAPFKSAEELEAYQPRSGAAAVLTRGKVVCERVCGICHGVDGLGHPGQAPARAGAEWGSTKGSNRRAHRPRRGISGPSKWGGRDGNGNRAAMGAA